MKMNKWILVASLLLSVAMATTGTLAFLTDRDSEANVFTVGNVSIELNETFEQGATLLPGLDVEKKPTITNTGKTDAWVWASIAIPSNLDDFDDASKNVVHFNYSTESTADGEWQWTDENGEWLYEDGVMINGVEYAVYTALYETPLKAGDVTKTPVIHKVYLDDHIDVDPEGNVAHVEKGVVTDLGWNINDAAQPTMYVSAYAIQTEGFATVQEGYAAYKNQWGDKGTEWGTPNQITNVANTADLKTALKDGFAAGADSVIVDAQGATLTDLGYLFTRSNVPAGKTVTIKNANLEGQSRWNYADGNLVFDNCTLENPNGAYTLHFDGGKGTVTFNNCTIKGYMSYAGTITKVVLNNCKLLGNGIYGFARFYQDAEMNNCVIDYSNNNDSWYVNGLSTIDSVLSLNNCDIVYSDFELADGASVVVDGTTVLTGDMNVDNNDRTF